MRTRLTAQVKAGGCASKLSPKILDRVLARLPRAAHPQVLVGFETSDDAGVYRISDELALVQTIDFFTPIVDDPFTFGAIAAANALSDVWAMGGTPITALSVLVWPGPDDLETLEEILLGGAAKMREANCEILGGHSVTDPEIKFGYAVTGTVHPDRVWTNAGARPGDVLVLTKRIGTGVISTALKRGLAAAQHVQAATESMLTLNRHAAEALAGLDVHSVTDVTGFGLLGHSREMAMASGVTLVIESAAVPLLEGAIDYARAGAIPGGTHNNRDFVASCVAGISALDDLLYDPQTSGGLLISLPAADAARFMERFPSGHLIGRVEERREKPILIQ
ncbi:MAG TPA: selenide, water dikinase SelD [Bryobacteraceae bacterium]|nr:selenide, water dikinase SelD [Bryobacteraceae bacterium]